MKTQWTKHQYQQWARLNVANYQQLSTGTFGTSFQDVVAAARHFDPKAAELVEQNVASLKALADHLKSRLE